MQQLLVIYSQDWLYNKGLTDSQSKFIYDKQGLAGSQDRTIQRYWLS